MRSCALLMNRTINLLEVDWTTNLLQAWTRMRERLKRLTELRGREKVVDWLVILSVVVRCKGMIRCMTGGVIK